MNSISDKVGYSGVLEIKLSSNTKSAKYKNSGTIDLFTSLCKFLAGITVENLPIPSFIDITNYEESILKSPSPITSAKVVQSDSSNSASVEYLASIGVYNLKMASNISDVKIKLLDQSTTIVLAEISLTEDSLSSFIGMLASLKPGTGINMALKWSLTLANSTQSVSLDNL
jgi:hypothetical protein